MDERSHGSSIEEQITVRAAPQEVFAALVEADRLIRWFPTTAASQARLGGRYRFTWEFERERERDHAQEGAYRSFEPGRALAYSWRGDAGRETIVAFRLEAHGDSTTVTLTHAGWGADADAERIREHHVQGWRFFLGNLKTYLERGEDQRASVLGMRTASVV